MCGNVLRSTGVCVRWRQSPSLAAAGEPGQWGVTPETQRLLLHWRDADRDRKLFLCQREAVETLIWLTEVEPKAYRKQIEDANAETNPGLYQLACKMATGAGKTTVMAMIIAWHAAIKANFLARSEKEKKDAERAEAGKVAEAQAKEMFDQLNWYATKKWGDNWSNARQYDLVRFAQVITNALRSDGVLSSNDTHDIKLMAAALSAKLIFGVNSAECQASLKKLQDRRN